MVSTKKYICSFCARPFSRSEHKLRHERSHTQTKPFICLCCNTSFVRRDLLQRHLRNVHKLNPSAVSERCNDGTSTSAASPSSPVASEVSLSGSKGIAHNHSHNNSSNNNNNNNNSNNSNNNNNNNSASIVDTENDRIIQLLTISRSYTNLQSSIKSHLPTLFFLYGTNSKMNISTFNNDCIYAILANGASFINIEDCVNLFNTAWLKNNDDLVSLTILAYTYLQNYEVLKSELLIPIEMLFEKLDLLLIKRLEKNGGNDWDFDYWKVYDIQSQYCFKFNKTPPSSHSNYFIKRDLIEGSNLNYWILSITKSLKFPKDDKFIIILNCIINELQNLKFNNNSQSTLTRHDLHNAIIILNKHYISKSIRNSSIHSSQFEKLLLISKRHVLLNVPQSFQDLIIDYVLIPKDEVHCRLLALTLKEFEYWNDINPIIFINDVQQWYDDLYIDIINNNLGLITYPLLFLGCLPLKTMNMDLGFKNFKNGIIEAFLILLKLIMTYENRGDNVVLNGAIYLIKEMTNCSNDKESLIENLCKIFENWLNYLEFQPLEIQKLKSLFITSAPLLIKAGNSETSLDSLSQIHHHQHLLTPQTYPTTTSLSSTNPSPQLSPTLKAETVSSSTFNNYITSPNSNGLFNGDLRGRITLPPINVNNTFELNKNYVNGTGSTISGVSSIESYKY